MATKTEKLGLDLWAPEDRLQMDSFNENTRQTEAVLGYMAAEPIFETTISAAASSVSIPMSGIDWSKYDYVVMDTVVGGNADNFQLYWRVNGDTSSDDQRYKYLGVTSLLSGVDAVVSMPSKTNVRRRIVFTVNKMPDKNITCTYEREDYAQGWGHFNGKTYSAFSTLVIVTGSSAEKVAKGGTIKIWGVKGCW